MVEEQSGVVYDIGYSYGNPCRYMQQVFKSFLKCLGLESQGEREGKEKGDRIDGGNGDGSGGGEVVDDPTLGDPSTMDPTDEPAISTSIARRRPPPRPPITSGGPGQTN
uniref:elicitor peptide 6-like isoform X2 n=1 Tax=Erigeron canadensis TaxID=72917 RepID=UPI001CB99BF5|nr:elicitor peptide 6-like isoform X2 [Erigeron canadensis]